MGLVELKVVMLGKENGGKTSLVERFLYDRFIGNQYQATVGAAFGARKMEVDGKSVTMAIWDTAGSERYEAMSRIYYRDAKAAVVCYDLTEKSSWDRAKFWVDELRRCEENCRVYLCGTKKDLIDRHASLRQPSVQEVERFSEGIKAVSVETSSKTGENVRELFTLVAEDYVRHNGNYETRRISTLKLEATPTSSWKTCCYHS